ncbi:hypothetical protein LENED_010168 [Lentinula edodes]|uniref:Uncharacterized protein n=1 Tax=Lentinula edodes TaxID=5353 RepID=A0A1Q3ELX9_LENED|nr:hypothetical protein LENED_010168 [Lentinula edodes]
MLLKPPGRNHVYSHRECDCIKLFTFTFAFQSVRYASLHELFFCVVGVSSDFPTSTTVVHFYTTSLNPSSGAASPDLRVENAPILSGQVVQVARATDPTSRKERPLLSLLISPPDILLSLNLHTLVPHWFLCHLQKRIGQWRAICTM